MNSRQRRKLRRFSERMYKAVNIGDVCWCVEPAWLDARPWIDVTGDGEAPPYMLFEKDQQPNGHDLGKVFESIFKSLDSGHPRGALKLYAVEASPDVWPEPPKDKADGTS